MQKGESEKTEDWKEMALRFAMGTMREMGNNIVQSFHEKMDVFFSAVARKIFSLLFFGVGIVFLLVGTAQLIEALSGAAFIGYISVGAVSVIIALFMSMIKR